MHTLLVRVSFPRLAMSQYYKHTFLGYNNNFFVSDGKFTDYHDYRVQPDEWVWLQHTYAVDNICEPDDSVPALSISGFLSQVLHWAS